MPPKPFTSPVDTYLSAANASEESKQQERAASPGKKTRQPKAAGAAVRPKSKLEKKKESLPPPAPVVEYGLFRCQVCDYRVSILPGSARPTGGWRCPVDFATLVLVSANY